jgi:hypothetical protein
MAGFLFRLETTDRGRQSRQLWETVVPNRRARDTIPLGRSRELRVVGIRDDDADRPRY